MPEALLAGVMLGGHIPPIRRIQHCEQTLALPGTPWARIDCGSQRRRGWPGAQAEPLHAAGERLEQFAHRRDLVLAVRRQGFEECPSPIKLAGEVTRVSCHCGHE